MIPIHKVFQTNEYLVMEAANSGFRFISYYFFKKDNNEVLAVVDPEGSIITGVQKSALLLGEKYDYGGVFGTLVVLFGRWLKKKWKNPFQSSSTVFCSEIIVKILQDSNYPGSSELTAASTTPQDLLDFFVKVGKAEKHLLRSHRP